MRLALALIALALCAADCRACDGPVRTWFAQHRPVRTFVANHRPGLLVPLPSAAAPACPAFAPTAPMVLPPMPPATPAFRFESAPAATVGDCPGGVCWPHPAVQPNPNRGVFRRY